MSHADQTAANRDLVVAFVTAAFIDRDVTAPERFLAADYKQHNPTIPNGPEVIPGVIASLPEDFKYEVGMVAADGDIVMVHGRFEGWGPKPLVAVDIFRVADGKVAEHWDVMQEEVPTEATANGNPMFTRP
uniref:SnoaL-like domain-containing protein n=1 Tax=Caulobacter sp. (strain K31) TaxID=366602 RepID=B0T939_CAUSK